ncbi:MAG TPA: nuclear transport factor 2 family protein [Acidimicrobiales bacterium]|nr:nuclear transport factor 2 family protein [Acidimicrobiales bacterium]
MRSLPSASYNNDMDTRQRQVSIQEVPAPRWSVAGTFVEALGLRDFDTMAGCLDPSVRLRGLLPPGPFEVVGPGDVMARFRQWFGGPDVFKIVDATVGEVGPKLYLRWRVTMTPAWPSAPTRLAEQHVFATIDRSIVGLDLLCSGFSDCLTVS